MKLGKGAAIAFVFLATCTQQEQEQEPKPDTPAIAPSVKTIAKPPASEVATWQPVGSTNSPKPRYLQAGAYDESRKVFVMFGGMLFDYMKYQGQSSKETWEWSPTTGKWTNRTGISSPEARSGAAMVYDSKRNKLVMFGGRSGSGLNLEDTWEWEPATGTWTNVSNGGHYPSGRSQHVMVYEKSTGKILLFGGGRTNKDYADGTGVSVSLGDTWEYDTATNTWTQLTPSNVPSGRHDLAATWDPSRNKVVLFGGLETEITGASGVPKQDTWEWDPQAATWTERTSAGNKPSQRYAHSMAFDSARGRALVFGGMDISTGGYLNDLWEWDPSSGAWLDRTNSNATTWPSGRRYASMVAIEGSSRVEVVGGGVPYSPYGGVGGYVSFYPYYGISGSKEVWELDASTATFTDRSVPLDVPTRRCSHAMAYYPETGKTYIFGGWDYWKGEPYDDMWEWNGSLWAKVDNKVSPPARGNAGMAYDPARKSLVLYGGQPYQGTEGMNDTWEWTSTSGWTQLKTTAGPDPLYGHGMVTDTAHNKVLLFGGYSYQYYFYSPDGGVIGAPMKSPFRNEVWEWDGAKQSWTNRTPTSSPQMPEPRQWPILDFDETRQTLLLFDGYSYNWSTGASSSSYWEWDTNTGGWALRDPGDYLDSVYNVLAVYDTIRRRHVFFTDTSSNGMPGGTNQTWELDVRGPSWYVRSQSTGPEARQYATMAFDPSRGVVVMFGGMLYTTGIATDETWEYKVTKWGNGTGCTSKTAPSCASGNCVDGVCCDTAACTGPCNSCNVAGSEGTCKPAKAGTVVPGSCENGQACDGTGKCLSANGQTCTSASTCASAFCTDGVCCDTACTGPCVSCAQSGKAGKCTPYAVGSDPQSECGKGDALCKSTCDGFGACVFPASGQPCSSCTVCDGSGKCSVFDPYCSFAGGAGGGFGGTGGYTTARGGSGGYTTARGGSGGYAGSGGTTSRGGSGGYAGSGGTTARGGSGGFAGSGGTTSRGGSGGTSVAGSGGTSVVGSGGTSVVSGTGGATVVGGNGGKPDAAVKDGGGSGIDGGEGTTILRLHRSGCYCAVGSAAAEPAAGLSLPLLAAGAVLAWRLRRRRR